MNKITKLWFKTKRLMKLISEVERLIGEGYSKEALKLIEEYRKEDFEIKLEIQVQVPKFCPNCGASFNQKFDDIDNPNIDLIHAFDSLGSGIWDACCPKCKWSGYIYPDSEYGLFKDSAVRESE